MDRMVWRISRGDRVAEVGEDGDLAGDPGLVGELRELLTEPITVYRRGTVAAAAGDAAAAIELRPGDRRYVVARIRTLCSPGSGYSITEVAWR